MECKLSLAVFLISLAVELIDTLWNVNIPPTKHCLVCRRINRYIMECKFDRCQNFFVKINGINRYIMECKSDIYKKNARRDNELIDTLWNVNTRLTYCSINYLSAN